MVNDCEQLVLDVQGVLERQQFGLITSEEAIIKMVSMVLAHGVDKE